MRSSTKWTRRLLGAGLVLILASCTGDSESGATPTEAGADDASDTGADVMEGDTAEVGESDATDSTDTAAPLGDGPSYSCLASACPAPECLALGECAAAWDCLGDCDTIACAEGCTALAPPPFKGIVDSAIGCGVEASCFAGGSGLDTCGNDVCDDGETLLNCPSDCSVWGDPDLILECMLAECGAGSCLGSNNCSAGLACMANCTSSTCSESCISNTPGGFNRNFLTGLLVCAVDAACLPPEAGPQCGNGDCELGEGKVNCPDDCGAAPPGYLCMLEQCETSFCPNFNSCNNSLECLGTCTENSCSKACIEGGPGQAQGLLISIGQCGAEAGCIPEVARPADPECGNTTCDVGETIGSCPGDCQVAPDLCGNGTCDIGESFEGCPADCQADGGSCAGTCGVVGDAVACHCTPSCEALGSCCSDYETTCTAYTCILENCDGATGCAGAEFCGQALSCISECTDSECAQPCKEGQPQQNIQFLDQYISCAVSEGCLELNQPSE